MMDFICLQLLKQKKLKNPANKHLSNRFAPNWYIRKQPPEFSRILVASKKIAGVKSIYKMIHEQYPKLYFYRRLVQSKLFIDAHYAEKIDLGNIADEASFSKFHFIRTFKNVYQKTPHQYLIFVRIEKATALLKEGMPVSEVCYAVGFESLSSFSGLFKRMVGLSPLAYTDRHQKIKTQIGQAPLAFIPGCFAEKNGWLKK